MYLIRLLSCLCAQGGSGGANGQLQGNTRRPHQRGRLGRDGAAGEPRTGRKQLRKGTVRRILLKVSALAPCRSRYGSAWVALVPVQRSWGHLEHKRLCLQWLKKMREQGIGSVTRTELRRGGFRKKIKAEYERQGCPVKKFWCKFSDAATKCFL